MFLSYICLVNLRFRVKKQATWLNLVTFASQKYAYYMKFEPDHAVISEQWQTQTEIEEPQLKHWALVLDFQLCVLRFVRWVRCGDYHPWNVREMNCEMSNFQLAQLLLPWSICCVENKREEKAWRPLWTTDPKLRNLAMNGFAVLANRCAEEDANVSMQIAVRSPVLMPWELSPRLGRVSWQERSSSANEVIVSNTVYNWLTVYITCQLTIWSFEKVVSLTKQCKWTDLIS